MERGSHDGEPSPTPFFASVPIRALSRSRSAPRRKLHGRTRQQRYAKLADWDYIRECVNAVRAREADEDRTSPWFSPIHSYFFSLLFLV